ncbi:hypothetical protein AC1031_013327 [Aphanomyces cochlioides]|nr:hypothetical protein AC1031_013327 [Aphanomyces cochlioides]
METLKVENQQLDIKIENLIDLLKEFEAKCDELQGQVDTHDSCMDKLRREKEDELYHMRSDMEIAQARVEELERLVNSQHGVLLQEIPQCPKCSAMVEAGIADSKHTTETSATTTTDTHTNDEMETLKVENQQLDIKIENLIDLLKEFEAKCDELQGQVDTHDSCMDKLRREKEDELYHMRSDMEIAQARVEELERLVNSQHGVLLQEIPQCPKCSAMVEAGIADSKHTTETSATTTTDTHTNDEMETLKVENQQLDIKIENLIDLLKEFEAKCDELQGQVDTHDSCMDKLRREKEDELYHMRSDMEIAQARVEELERLVNP